MKIISLFNNKGGVGKSTLSYHLGCALGILDKKVLFVDLDPQCNLTINAMFEREIESIWQDENPYMEDFSGVMEKNSKCEILNKTRSVHFFRIIKLLNSRRNLFNILDLQFIMLKSIHQRKILTLMIWQQHIIDMLY